MSFSLQNDQAEVQRFEFPEHDDFTFVPSMGHIQPGKSMEIVAEFLPASIRAINENQDGEMRKMQLHLNQ